MENKTVNGLFLFVSCWRWLLASLPVLICILDPKGEKTKKQNHACESIRCFKSARLIQLKKYASIVRKNAVQSLLNFLHGILQALGKSVRHLLDLFFRGNDLHPIKKKSVLFFVEKLGNLVSSLAVKATLDSPTHRSHFPSQSFHLPAAATSSSSTSSSSPPSTRIPIKNLNQSFK